MKPSWSQTRLLGCGGAVLPAKKSIAHYSVSVGGGFNSLFIPPRRSASPCMGGTEWRSQIEIGAAPVRKGRPERCDRGCGVVIDEAC